MSAIMNNPPLFDRRKELRKNQTEAERKLWSRLRDRRFFGLKFRRQQSVGSYILDFYCADRKIAVEVDGGQHADNKDYDVARSLYLSTVGIKVVRYWNNDVLKNIDSVLEDLMRVLKL